MSSARPTTEELQLAFGIQECKKLADNLKIARLNKLKAEQSIEILSFALNSAEVIVEELQKRRIQPATLPGDPDDVQMPPSEFHPPAGTG